MMQGQGLATLDCDSWIKKGGGCACICVRVCRLREWNQNEKCVRWLGNKEPSVIVLEFVVFVFISSSYREVQVCRYSIYLFHTGTSSDVHRLLPKSELVTNTAGALFACSWRRSSL